jgi:hypothetical protein
MRRLPSWGSLCEDQVSVARLTGCPHFDRFSDFKEVPGSGQEIGPGSPVWMATQIWEPRFGCHKYRKQAALAVALIDSGKAGLRRRHSSRITLSSYGAVVHNFGGVKSCSSLPASIAIGIEGQVRFVPRGANSNRSRPLCLVQRWLCWYLDPSVKRLHIE